MKKQPILSRRKQRKAAGKNKQIPFYKKLLISLGIVLALCSINDPRFGMRKLYEPYSKEQIEKPGRTHRAGERVGGDKGGSYEQRN